MSEKSDKWFRNLVRTNKASRSENVKRNDFFETLLQIQEKHSKNFYIEHDYF